MDNTTVKKRGRSKPRPIENFTFPFYTKKKQNILEPSGHEFFWSFDSSDPSGP
jgi:hypothetical protein